MPFANLALRLRERNAKTNPLHIVCIMLFFWSLFDGIGSYIAPLAITDDGLSKTMLGLVIGSSSFFGAIFDFLMSKYLRNTHFRRIYLLMFALCFTYPLILWHAKTIWIFLIAM